jgi:hypothetical protein
MELRTKYIIYNVVTAPLVLCIRVPMVLLSIVILWAAVHLHRLALSIPGIERLPLTPEQREEHMTKLEQDLKTLIEQIEKNGEKDRNKG